jgi:hypothetical protein
MPTEKNLFGRTKNDNVTFYDIIYILSNCVTINRYTKYITLQFTNSQQGGFLIRTRCDSTGCSRKRVLI